MPELLRMPEVATNTTEAVLLSWPVAENVPFASRDTIATVETAKAVVDVEAENDGVILRTLVAEGTEVAVGEPIALIAGTGEVVSDVDAALAQLGQSPDAKGARALEIPEADPAPATPAPGPSLDLASHRTAAANASPGSSVRLFASPLARRLARDASLVLDGVVGSGPNGRIVRRDIEAAISARDAAPLSLTANDRDDAAFTDVPVTRLRRLIATRLSESKQTTPHFYLRGSARVDSLLALRAELNDGAEVRVSVNDLLIKAVARTHKAVPALNVSYLGDAIRQFLTVDVSVAIATKSGLVTPVVRGAENRSVTDIASTVSDFVARAQSGQLRQHDLDGGSVTVTNLGMYGVAEFAAIINPPQASILAIGAAREEPIVRQGKVIAATMLNVTLSVDHRAVDGAQAAEWMAAFVSLLEHPVRILA
jgi:pyruvate dehydrogenase E2 component (dihydrolipoamide acetyltransferase)